MLRPSIFQILISLILFSDFVQAQSYCVKNDMAKLFPALEDNSKPPTKAPIYTPLLGTGNRRETHGEMWAEVIDADAQKFWVQKSNLTTKWNCLVVNVGRTSLRSGPGKNFAPAKTRFAQKHQAYVDLGGEDGWTQVKDKSGETFWMNIDHVWKAKSKMRISFEGH